MPTADASAAVRFLIAAIPEQCLRDLCMQLALSLPTPPPPTSPAEPSARRKRGRPAKKGVDPKLAARRKRYEANRKAKRQAAKAAKTDTGNGKDAPITAQAFWQRCEQIEPGAPWRIPVREFGTRDTVAKQAFQARTLPPHIGAMALNKFLGLQAS
jgi:hypothetical protein